MIPRILIDKEFKGIIPPLKEDEYKCLEESLRMEGCRDPIILWNDTIVDGHNRYEICTRLNIPYKTIHKGFASRAEAISWICLNQLSRRNISEEAFRYLVGKRYDAEKQIAQRKNSRGLNQYSPHQEDEDSPSPPASSNTPAHRRTSTQIGRLYNLNHATVERYGRLSRSLDEIERKSPGMLPVILSGACKISKDNIDLIANMPDQYVHSISFQLHSKVADKKHVTIRESGRTIQELCETEKQESSDISQHNLITSIKNMPAYDPDAIINEILLTVPSWKNELDRLIKNDDLTRTSKEARKKLINVLSDLQLSVSQLQSIIKE